MTFVTYDFNPNVHLQDHRGGGEARPPMSPINRAAGPCLGNRIEDDFRLSVIGYPSGILNRRSPLGLVEKWPLNFQSLVEEPRGHNHEISSA